MLTPNMNSLAVRLIGAKYRYIFPEHLNYFTPQTMKKFRRRRLLLAPKFDSPGRFFSTGIIGKACLQAV